MKSIKHERIKGESKARISGAVWALFSFKLPQYNINKHFEASKTTSTKENYTVKRILYPISVMLLKSFGNEIIKVI